MNQETQNKVKIEILEAKLEKMDKTFYKMLEYSYYVISDLVDQAEDIENALFEKEATQSTSIESAKTWLEELGKFI